MKAVGKVALVTGCSSGFGHAVVGRLLERGWTVIASMRNAGSRGALFAPERSRFGTQLELCELDVTSAADRDAVARLIQLKFGGKLDLLVNNAGFGLFGALEDLSEEQIKRQMDVNFLGVAYLTRKLLPQLRAAHGRIINVSSFFGVSTAPLNSLYCASKFALEGLSEALYFELQPHGVQVALVEPGATKTQFGSNVVWGERSHDLASPYAFQTANFQVVKQKIGERAPDMSGVVQTIARLAEARRMPLRNFCGRDAKALRCLMRLMPAALFTALLSSFFARSFSKREAATLKPKTA
ncbi:MAG TPA: SDR family oxidoreductase [Bdellovibrionales bacterium]|nr:SDR family oxidoreductase [Bdellovibrionales bacterium]